MQHTILEGEQRQRVLADEDCCMLCGFRERGLIVWSAGNSAGVHCIECFENISPSGASNFAPAFIPELSVAVLAHYVRAAAWQSFAARIGCHDVSTLKHGKLPAYLGDPMRWTDNFIFFGSGDFERNCAGHAKHWKSFHIAEQSFDFLKARIKAVRTSYETDDPCKIIAKVGEENFAKLFRMVPLKFSVQRIRTWGDPGSTFANQVNKPKAATEQL